MGGICGIYNFRTRKPIDDQTLAKMAASIRHRGVDFNKKHLDGYFGFTSQTTNHANSSDICCAVDGAIFNKIKLRSTLEQHGLSFSSDKEASFLEYAYRIFGQDFINEIDGEFAFCVWDKPKQRLILGRSHAGNKPLYYYEHKDGIVFASEIKSILASGEVTREIDTNALDAFFSYTYVPNPRTLFKGITQIPAGSMLICQNNSTKIITFWRYNLKEINRRMGEGECCEILSCLLENAVKKRLDSDSDLGAFLSGGIDTTINALLMKKLLKTRPKVFSVGFEDAGYNELPSAEKTSELFGLDLHKITVSPQMGKKALPKVIWHTDSPFWDVSSIPTYYAGLIAGNNVSTVITGDGSDQLLAGSNSYAYWKQQMVLFPDFARTKVLSNIASLFSGFKAKSVLVEKLSRNALIESMPLEQRFALRSSLIPFSIKQSVYSPEFRLKADDNILLKMNNANFQSSNRTNFIDKLLYNDVSFFLQDDLLVKVDRMLSASGLEFRTPFLDKDLMDFISTIPVEYKLKGIIKPVKKYILKKAFKTNIPKHVLEGRKMGFSPPHKKWMQNEFKDIIYDNLLVRNCGLRRYFDAGFISKALEGFNSNEYPHNLGLIWAFFVFEVWHRAYISGKEITMPAL